MVITSLAGGESESFDVGSEGLDKFGSGGGGGGGGAFPIKLTGSGGAGGAEVEFIDILGSFPRRGPGGGGGGLGGLAAVGSFFASIKPAKKRMLKYYKSKNN